MKKLILIISLVFSFISNVNAANHNIICNYESGTNKINIEYLYAFNSTTIKSLTYSQNNSSTFSYKDGDAKTITEYYKNLYDDLYVANSSGGGSYTGYTTNGYFAEHINDTTNDTNLCPTKIYVSSSNNKFEFYACAIYKESDGSTEDTCTSTKKYINDNNINPIELSLTTPLHYETNELDNTNTNLEEVHDQITTDLAEAEKLKNKYCAPDFITQNGKTDCDEITAKIEELKKQQGLVEDEAESLGINISTWNLESKDKIDFDTSNGCVSYLGNPETKGEPAYYLQFIFNLMKYAAIILLLVLTIMEFSKATVSSNQDAMKKALQNTIKRLIIAVIIFFLPILIKFVFELLGIYSAGTCGIA